MRSYICIKSCDTALTTSLRNLYFHYAYLWHAAIPSDWKIHQCVSGNAVKFGVPKGSILELILFIQYYEPLHVQFYNVFIFADDTKCPKHINSTVYM